MTERAELLIGYLRLGGELEDFEGWREALDDVVRNSHRWVSDAAACLRAVAYAYPRRPARYIAREAQLLIQAIDIVESTSRRRW